MNKFPSRQRRSFLRQQFKVQRMHDEYQSVACCASPCGRQVRPAGPPLDYERPVDYGRPGQEADPDAQNRRHARRRPGSRCLPFPPARGTSIWASCGLRCTMTHGGVRFGVCELSAERIELRRAGTIVDIEPQVFDVLAYLLRHRERVVPKTELLDQIWGNRFVSESALSSRIKSARRAVGDTGRDQRIIKTIYGRGYRF